MFEQLLRLFEERDDSLVEAELRRLFDDVVFEVDGERHGTRRRPLAVEPEPAEPEPAEPEHAEPEPVEAEPAEAATGCPLEGNAERLDRLVTAGHAHLDAARGAQRQQARAAAEQARALAAFARTRPSSLDRPDTEIGAAAAQTRAARHSALASVSEWAVDEVMVGLGLTTDAATCLLVDSLLLVDRLPATLDALSDGRITWAHAQVMTDLIAPLPDDVRAAAEERLLAKVDGRTRTQLRAAARRMVQKLDASAVARRVTEAVRDRRVTVHAGDDGMATLGATLPAPVARAVQDALGRYADAAAVEGDERTRQQRMVDCLVDLVLRPGEHGLAPVQAQITLVAAVETLLGGSEPGEVDGDLVPAEMVRELAIALGLMPRLEADAPEVGAEGPAEPEAAGASVDAGDHSAGDDCPGGDDVADTARADGRRAALADLLTTRAVRGTALAHRPHITLVDELSGQLVALTDAFALRAGGALGPPPESPGYSPGAELDRFVRLRDRRCRFPGCRARPIRCDLDHTVPWPLGPTSHDNLCSLCRHHHRLSHQAPGWHMRGLPGGGLEWTTPSGQVVTTHPIRFGADDWLDHPPPESSPAADPPPADPRPPDAPPDDPPPF